MDHALNITLPSLSPSIEKVINRAFDSFERLCRDVSDSVSFVAYGIAAYLVMAGISRLVEARNKHSLPPSTSNGGENDESKNLM